jgi:heavy metal sensor kinase
MMSRLPLRARLTLWYAGVLTLVLAAYASGVFVVLRQSLMEDLDRALHDDRETAEQMLERLADGSIGWRPAPAPHDHDHDEDTGGRWLEVRGDHGRLLYARPAAIPHEPPARRSSAPYVVDGMPVTLVVARSEEPLRRELRELLLVMALGLPMAVALAAVGGYALARRALAPVARLADRARAITADRLDERLPVERPRDELGQMAVVFNETLGRLQRSFEQLRRFTADASHELRTPLTAMKTVGEVGLGERREDGYYREVIGSMLEEVDRLTHLVDGLLTLSRADGGTVRLDRAPEDLGDIARDVAGQLGVLAEEKRQRLVVESGEHAVARVDRALLRQALINLVDNAIKYSPKGGEVRIVVRDGAQGPSVEVSDTGPGIPPEHRARVFDRFYRIDRGRSRELGGTGLGLSIARWAVEANGGRLELASADHPGCTFRASFPPVTEGG